MAALQHVAAFAPSVLGRRQLMPGKINAIRSVLLVSCFSTSFPTKRTGRKNHLRQKILKTLKKPIIPKLPPANPILPTDSPTKQTEETDHTQGIRESEKSEISETGNEEVKESEVMREIEGSEPAGVGIDGNVGIFPKNSILKYGLWLVGAFVFQTVCAVWFFGLAEVDNKSEILNGTGESRVKVVLNGNVNGKIGLQNSAVNSNIYVDELEMERKIEEIKVMAREAREKERLESKRNGLDSEDSEETDEGKYSKSGIEEEVDNRLVKLRKKLGNTRPKMPVASVGYLRKESERRDGVEKGELDDRDSNGALLFKKKYKFKGLSGDPIEKPKGFGSDDTRIRSGKGDKNAVGIRDGANQTEGTVVDSKRIDEDHAVEEDDKKGMLETNEPTRNTRKKAERERGASKQGKGKAVSKPKVVDDIALNGGSALESTILNGEAVKSRKSSALDSAVVSDNLSKGSDTFRGKGVGGAKLAIKSERETDFWWLNLPYVLAIAMRRGNDGEGGEGLYTLRSISSTKDQISHMVAFEDQADATNFCYLLQSFFEELEIEDFQADIVPLTIKELKEALQLFDERVLVVKRGQLELYAGQPLTEAEVALRAMIKQG